MHDSGIPERRGRRVVYGADGTSVLKEISEAASHSCGENLHALIPEYKGAHRSAMENHAGKEITNAVRTSHGTERRG